MAYTNEPTLYAEQTNLFMCDCGNEIEIDIDSLKHVNDCLRVDCTCGKQFILGKGKDDAGDEFAFTFPMFDGQAIAYFLKSLLTRVSLPVAISDEIEKHAKFNRWNELKRLVKRYSTAITANAQLVNFLNANLLG